MNNRSRKTKGLSHRLIALLLCCVCLLAAMPAYAIALEPGAAPAAGETAAENPAEEAAAGSADAAVYTGPEAALTADTLYARLMACTTYEEMEAIINALSEEERLLLDQFTEEQKAALEAKKSELSASVAEPSSEAATEPAAQETTAPTGTGETTAPAATEGTTEPTGETEATASTEPTEAMETTAPSAETDPTEETAAGSEADALFARLMAYETFEELDAALNSLTEDEQALLDQFTEEQNAALEARMKELGGYAIDILVSYSGTLTITDTIQTDGRLTVSASGLQDGQTAAYVWEKSTDNQNWTEVTREKVTGDQYNVADNGSWVNVALDGGARCYYRVKIVKIDEATVGDKVYSASEQVTYYDALQNGSFETPAVSGETFISSGANGIVWQTTEDKKQIELVRPVSDPSGIFKWHGVINAAEGAQCAEINANGAGALYQDVLTVPGSTMYWQLSHLGRSMNGSPLGDLSNNGTGSEQTDTMYVLIMPYESAKAITTQTQVQYVMDNLSSYTGAQVKKITYTWRWQRSDNTYTMQHYVNGSWEEAFTCSKNGDTYTNIKEVKSPWEVHGGSYTVPKGQYLTRYFFVSGSTASKDNTVGNHIDHVHFSTELPKPSPGSANLTIQKTIDVADWNDMTNEQQQKFKEAVSFTYGETNVSGKDMTWIGNVGTYQTNISFGVGGSTTVKVTESLSDVDGYVWGGTDTDKIKEVTLRDGGSATAEFVNPYTVANKTLTIRKIVSGNMYNENDRFKFTVSYGGESKEFTLGNGSSETISIPIGADVIVTENRGDYICTVRSVTEGLSYISSPNGLTFTMPGYDVTVEINNEKSVIVDTGVILDTLPYVLILAVVVVGVVLLMKKRRYRDED